MKYSYLQTSNHTTQNRSVFIILKYPGVNTVLILWINKNSVSKLKLRIDCLSIRPSIDKLGFFVQWWANNWFANIWSRLPNIKKFVIPLLFIFICILFAVDYCNALRDLAPFVQFKKTWKRPMEENDVLIFANPLQIIRKCLVSTERSRILK